MAAAWTDAQTTKWHASQTKIEANRAAQAASLPAAAALQLLPEPEPEPERPVGAAAAARGAPPQQQPCWWDALETGDTVRLEHVPTGFRLALIVATTWSGRTGKGEGLMLARPAQPYHRLLATNSAKAPLRWKTTLGCPDALWTVQRPDPDADQPPSADSTLCTVRNLKRRATHLVMAADGQLSVGEGGAGAVWCRLPAAEAAAPAQPPLTTRSQTPAGPSAEVAAVAAAADPAMSYQQFLSQGYALLPGLVGGAACDGALRLINHHLGSTQSRQVAPGQHGLGAEFLSSAVSADGGDGDDGSAADSAGVIKLGSLALHPDLNAGMLGPAECAALESALQLAPGDIKPPVGCQLALRFPLPPLPHESRAEQATTDADTLDGLRRRLQWHSDINKYNDKKTFDFVVGIFLSPVTQPTDGALWVLPGSHLSPTPTPAAALEYASSGAAVPTPILTHQPGDAIVFHRRMVHAGGPCLAPGIVSPATNRPGLSLRLRTTFVSVLELHARTHIAIAAHVYQS